MTQRGSPSGSQDSIQAWLVTDPASLSRFNEASYAQTLRTVANHWFATHERWADVIAGRVTDAGPFAMLDVGEACVVAGPGGAVFNNAAGFGADDPSRGENNAGGAAAFQRAIDFIDDHARQSGHSAAYEFELGPYASREALDYLAEQGLNLVAMLTVLAKELSHDEPQPTSPPPGITLRPLEKSSDAEIIAAAECMSNAIASSSMDASNGRQFLAGLQWMSCPDVDTIAAFDEQGDIIATANAIMNDAPTLAGSVVEDRFSRPKTVHLIKTAVGPGARGRGLQKSLMTRRLRRAADAGATLAVVDCEAGLATERNARRLGFQTIYSKAVLHRPTATK